MGGESLSFLCYSFHLVSRLHTCPGHSRRGLWSEFRELWYQMNRAGVKDDPSSKMGKGPFTLGHSALGLESGGDTRVYMQVEGRDRTVGRRGGLGRPKVFQDHRGKGGLGSVLGEPG